MGAKQKKVRTDGKKYSVDEWARRETIASQMPLVFDSGAKWTEITLHCTGCDRAFFADEVRGEVHTVTEDKFRSQRIGLYYVDAMGYCEGCRLLTPMRVGLHPNMTMATLEVDSKGKTWMNVYGPARTWWERLVRWWRGLFRRGKHSVDG